jgi:hypothetical protein
MCMPGGNRIRRNTQQDSRFSGQNSKLTPLEYNKCHQLDVALLKHFCMHKCETSRYLVRLKNGDFHPIFFPLIVKGNDGCKQGDIHAKMFFNESSGITFCRRDKAQLWDFVNTVLNISFPQARYLDPYM